MSLCNSVSGLFLQTELRDRSVCRSVWGGTMWRVGRMRHEPCKNGWTNRAAVWDGDWGVPGELYIRLWAFTLVPHGKYGWKITPGGYKCMGLPPGRRCGLFPDYFWLPCRCVRTSFENLYGNGYSKPHQVIAHNIICQSEDSGTLIRLETAVFRRVSAVNKSSSSIRRVIQWRWRDSVGRRSSVSTIVMKHVCRAKITTRHTTDCMHDISILVNRYNIFKIYSRCYSMYQWRQRLGLPKTKRTSWPVTSRHVTWYNPTVWPTLLNSAFHFRLTADRQTDRQTDVSITIHRSPVLGRIAIHWCVTIDG